MFKFIADLVLGAVFKLFGINRDERMGSLTEININQKRQIDDVKKANILDNAVDGMSDAELKQLQDDLNERD